MKDLKKSGKILKKKVKKKSKNLKKDDIIKPLNKNKSLVFQLSSFKRNKEYARH